MPMIMEVTSLTVALTKSLPPAVIVRAEGEVPTTGWTHPSLDPLVYLVAPEDGIREFSFDADSPSGPAGQKITAISAKTVFTAPPWLKGVRVRATDNAIEELIVHPNAVEAAPAL